LPVVSKQHPDGGSQHRIRPRPRRPRRTPEARRGRGPSDSW
jgi:hypothetical protein